MALTGYTRSWVTHRVKDGTFPPPRGRMRIKTRMVNYYDKKEVDSWIERNKGHVSRSLSRKPTVVSQFNNAQMRSIRDAAKALACDVDTFSHEAILFKARFVLARVAEEGLD